MNLLKPNWTEVQERYRAFWCGEPLDRPPVIFDTIGPWRHPMYNDAVLVSPCISPGEKAIARAAFAAGLPLAVLQENGFAPHDKPSGRYFDACAAGRLLMLAPFPYHRQRQSITREQCQELNAWAQAIAEDV